MNVNNIKNENIIVELLSGKNKDALVERQIMYSSKTVIFDLLDPKKYTLRVCIDSNKNNKFLLRFLRKKLGFIIFVLKFL